MTKIAKGAISLLFILCLLLLSACSGSRIVQPLNQSQWQLSASFGGPLLEDQKNQTRIVPLSSVTAAYGLKQNLSIFTSWHTGSYLYDLFHFDLGYAHEIVKPFAIRPGITYSAQANILSQTNFDDIRFYPQIDFNAYWIIANKNYTYLGMSNLFEMRSTAAHGQNQEKFWFPALHAGYSRGLGKYSGTVEAKYILPFNKEEKRFVDFINYNDSGAIGLYFSIARTFP